MHALSRRCFRFQRDDTGAPVAHKSLAPRLRGDDAAAQLTRRAPMKPLHLAGALLMNTLWGRGAARPSPAGLIDERPFPNARTRLR